MKLKRILFIAILLLILLTFTLLACAPKTFNDKYEYTTENKSFLRPSSIDQWVVRDALYASTEDGEYYCFTNDESKADSFVNSQRTLLRFLRKSGVDISKLTYYATDYGYSFSRSEKTSAYIDFSDMKSYRQILVTMQSLFGNYTDYGYLYALSNHVAKELGWLTDEIKEADAVKLDAFFLENPEAVGLLYPVFTEEYATAETVGFSKALSLIIFDCIDLRKVLSQPIDTQIENARKLIKEYADGIGVEYAPDSCGYAYYGENIPLRIMTDYAEMFIDDDYSDISENVYGDYFGNYKTVYHTANNINSEISQSVANFDLHDTEREITIVWLSKENADEKFYENFRGHYYLANQTAYVTTIQSYLHEYHHHIEYTITQNNPQVWQSQAFCELGTARSQYGIAYLEYFFAEGMKNTMFETFAGREFLGGVEDYYEINNILAFLTTKNGRSLDYWASADMLNSINKYLIDFYSAPTVEELYLDPDAITEKIGKTWDELESEWLVYLNAKYAGVDYEEFLQ